MTDTKGTNFVITGSPDPITLSAFILGLASATLVHLGGAPDPETKTLGTDLAAARQSIDLLELLATKTRGNLSTEEEGLFFAVLADLRLRYVEKRNAAQ